jgi:hypothetical protein
MEATTELRISCSHVGDGLTTAVIRRSEDSTPEASWFSLSDLLFFLAKSGPQSTKNMISQLSLSQKREANQEWWLSKDGLLKVYPFS